MRALVINSGSSSVKFEVFQAGSGLRSLLEGEVERIGTPDAGMWIQSRADGAATRETRAVAAADHRAALAAALDAVGTTGVPLTGDTIAVVGHRVVHGGRHYSGPVLIDDEVVERIGTVALLAPLHTRANLAGIEAARACLPDAAHVAVFDTAFHRTMAPHAYEYALPRAMAEEHGIRRYGFHGISHAYVAGRAATLLGAPLEELDLITLHLGAGASAAAIHAGKSVDTSMGMTPLEGLVMGTRCGDLDPAIPMLLGVITGRTREDVHRLLNHESGLVGLCGTSDMREVHDLAEAGDDNAQDALALYCYRVKKYIGAYVAALGRVDALVFTAGVGENDAQVRERICEGLGCLGITIDVKRNRTSTGGERFVSPEGASVAVLVVPTNEEREIARLALACVGALDPGCEE